MNTFKYILKSFWFYKKQNFAVLLSTLVSTAVLTGALIIGDSVKYSLHSLINLRLGHIEYAMPTGDRYVRDRLAEEISNDLHTDIAAVLQANGIAINPETNRRLSNIQVYGVDRNFWNFAEADINIDKNEAFISTNLSEKLGLSVNDQFVVRVEKGSMIPANAPFVSDEDQSLAIRLKIKSIAEESDLGRFSLKNNQIAPFNVFVSRKYLAELMELKGSVNLLLASGNGKEKISSLDLKRSLKEHWKSEDAGLQLKELKGKNELELTSARVFIDSPITNAIEKIDKNQKTILTYFVNGFKSDKGETPYSFVTSGSDDFGYDLKKNEIILNDWTASDLKVKIGDQVKLNFYAIGVLRRLEEKSETFTVKDIRKITEPLWDQSMMPSFPGLSDAGSCNEWEAGVPVDFSKIRPQDEDYWKKYKGTPKAIITQSTALNLWSNKYGEFTGVRFDANAITKASLQKQILTLVPPEMLNLQFLSVRSEGTRAADNMVDFGGLFLSLSFFIILAAILLTVLIYSLNLDNRSNETGILSGLGFNQNQIFRIRIFEPLTTIVLGGCVGVLGGIVYNKLLLGALNSVWQDVVRTNMLSVHLEPSTLAIGWLVGVLLALICIFYITRKKLKKSTISLIQGNKEKKRQLKNSHLPVLISILAILACIAIIAYVLASSIEQNAELLLLAGGLFIVASIAFVYYLLKRLAFKQSTQTPGLFQLAIRNAARNLKRSLSVIILLALGTFSVLITGANRKTFLTTQNDNKSGTGGFEYWMESSLPVLSDLNTTEGQEKAGFWEGDLEESVSFVQFRTLEGDDASCLNLNQVSRPQVLGFNPEKFNQKDAFSFVKLHSKADELHPWKILEQDFGTDIIPAIADQTVIQWGLKKAVGDTVIYTNEFGHKIKLLLVGGLANSIFQGNILISDRRFQEHFPSVSGSKIILADCSPGDTLFVNKMEDNLQDLGLVGTQTSERLAAFYSVENTYLSMFMLLGGLGVIIGTIGLGIVLTRNIWERKKELALLDAIGYSGLNIFKLLLFENLFLLLTGLVCGIVSAFIGVLPSFLSPAFQMPYNYVLIILASILLSGLVWIVLPISLMKQKNIAKALRDE